MVVQLWLWNILFKLYFHCLVFYVSLIRGGGYCLCLSVCTYINVSKSVDQNNPADVTQNSKQLSLIKTELGSFS